MRFVVSVVLSIVAHLVLGWSWSIVGGITCGYWLGTKNGFVGALTTGMIGALCVGIAWAALVGYNLIVAPVEIQKMLGIMGGFWETYTGALSLC